MYVSIHFTRARNVRTTHSARHTWNETPRVLASAPCLSGRLRAPSLLHHAPCAVAHDIDPGDSMPDAISESDHRTTGRSCRSGVGNSHSLVPTSGYRFSSPSSSGCNMRSPWSAVSSCLLCFSVVAPGRPSPQTTRRTSSVPPSSGVASEPLSNARGSRSARGSTSDPAS